MEDNHLLEVTNVVILCGHDHRVWEVFAYWKLQIFVELCSWSLDLIARLEELFAPRSCWLIGVLCVVVSMISRIVCVGDVPVRKGSTASKRS